MAEFGLDEGLILQLTSSAKTKNLFDEVIAESGLRSSDKGKGFLFFYLATNIPVSNPTALQARKLLSTYIAQGLIVNQVQIDHAVKYLKKAVALNVPELDQVCGKGVIITDSNIEDSAKQIMNENKEELSSQGYRFNIGKLYTAVNANLKFADSKKVKLIIDNLLLNLLGPKPKPEDSLPIEKEKNKKANNQDNNKTNKNNNNSNNTNNNSNNNNNSNEGPFDISFLDTGRDVVWAHNTPEQMEKHLNYRKSLPNSTIITRFPPEPNGFLHLGHAKAMNFNFGTAKKVGGQCIMRFDDTNPEAEKQIYIDNILENVAWLGHKQSRTTYSSDYFGELYDLAVKLIKNGKAYVCHQTTNEIKAHRKARKENPNISHEEIEKLASPWRNENFRSREQNLIEFENMRKGKYEEGKATLRLKADLFHPNPQIAMDIVAYRIKYSPHPHAGDKWCIYPSYDYTHCIIDSLENITHSCCTLEFEIRRESYFWLLYELDLYKPKVWEYSRLNLEYNVMSKRRLLTLVTEGHVRGWDDPRLLTLNGLRRRGYTPEAINNFCETVGVSRTNQMIPLNTLESAARLHLETVAKRCMVVENPVKVILENYDPSKVEVLNVPDFPKDESRGHHQIPFSRVLFVDRSDIKLVDEKDFFGIAPGKTILLKYAYNITINSIETDPKDTTLPILVKATVDVQNKTKVKGVLQWVAEPSPGVEPLKLELRLYDTLFQSPNPMAFHEWIEDLNPDSMKIVKNAYADPSLTNSKPGDKFQFERLAFFVCDPDSTQNHLVFNRTVTLKEAKAKQNLTTKKPLAVKQVPEIDEHEDNDLN